MSIEEEISELPANSALPDASYGPVMSRRNFLRGGFMNVLSSYPLQETKAISAETQKESSEDDDYVHTFQEISLIFVTNLAITRVLNNVEIVNGNQNLREMTIAQSVILQPLFEEMVIRYIPSTLLDMLTEYLSEQEGMENISTKGSVQWLCGILNSVFFAYLHNNNGKEMVRGLPLQQFLGGLYLWYAMRKKGFDHAYVAHATYNLEEFMLKHLHIR